MPGAGRRHKSNDLDAVITPKRDGELILYVNDSIWPFDGKRGSTFYDAHDGKAVIEVRQTDWLPCMIVIILFATLAIALPFVIAKGALPFGTAVSQRFLSGKRMMETRALQFRRRQKPETSSATSTLAMWVHAHADLAGGYARHVIPLDIVYLVCLGLFLAMASVTLRDLTEGPSFLSHIPIWVHWLLPCVYIACDLSEDLLIVDLAGDNRKRRRSGHFRSFATSRLRRSASRSFKCCYFVLRSYIWPATAKL